MIYETKLPVIHAERLTTPEQMKAEADRLTRQPGRETHKWSEEDQAVVRVRVQNGYGNDVRVWEEIQFRLGSWVVWSDTVPTRHIILTAGTSESLTPDNIPAALLRLQVVV